MRVLCFTIGRFGNSDPKKFPKDAKRFMPFAWDKKKENKLKPKDILEQHRLMKQKREQLINGTNL